MHIDQNNTSLDLFEGEGRMYDHIHASIINRIRVTWFG